MQKNKQVGVNYEKFYAQRSKGKLYPTEFVVRTFLADYPNLLFPKPSLGAKVLDMGFGDGRNTFFLCEQGLAVSGIEITDGIVSQLQKRLHVAGLNADLRVGRNSATTFFDNYFDCILACHCCYYCDEGQTILDNLKEYSRILKPNGWLIASLARADSYIFDNALPHSDGSYTITNDPYKNRNGYRLHAFAENVDVEKLFKNYFCNFSFGSAVNNYYGVDERLIWVVCQNC